MDRWTDGWKDGWTDILLIDKTKNNPQKEVSAICWASNGSTYELCVLNTHNL